MAVDSTLARIFCRNLREIRLGKNLTQVQVAETLGMTQSQFASIEAGRNAPTLPTIERISLALDIPVVELLSLRESYREPQRATA